MADPHSLTLEISDEAGHVSRQTISGQRLVIGRSAECQIRLDRTTVSRRHAELFFDPFQRWWVRDLQSRNGTQVNGDTIADRMLSPGDTLTVGEFTLRIAALGDSATATRPPENLRPLEISEAGAPAITTLKDLEAPRISSTHLSTLNEFGQRLLKIEDPTERLRALCKLLVRDEFHGDCAMVLRVTKPTATHQGAHAPRILIPPETSPRWRQGPPYISRTLLRALAQREEPILASNVPMQGAMMAEISLSPDVMSISTIACPVRSDDQTLDVLYIILPPQFGTGEWLALAALATKQYQQSEMTLAAQGHAVIERELQRARQIQLNLLPKNPSIGGLDLAIGFKPCRWVGGDYVDIITTSDGRTLLVVADVCGKGMGAALLAASLHSVVRVAVRSAMPLAELMRHLNEHLCQMLASQSFVTMVCVLIDPKTGQLECVNAGHPPAMLIRADGEVRLLQCAENFPMGIQTDALISQTESMHPGELLLMFTDGLSDLTDSSGHRLGTDAVKDHLKEIYQSHPSLPASDLSAKLTEILDSLESSAMAQDDRTFLLARRT
ncbi:MAG TPA: SpoIIE family protein phosphatase [Tepidisphaeraceae bacterium]|jgi:serine phosphatase RsbU (regulator of sigma subunit)|nr:SpoIIE family protein phosphatase [Tepidisphaeraceae bacterium]